MSLLKARRTTDKLIEELSGEMILDEFKNYLDRYIKKPEREMLIKMVAEYGIYSYTYLNLIANDFRARPVMKDAMTYMNSVMAEVFHELEIPYFHPEEGYSCIDKACSYVMDEGEVGLEAFIDKTMDEIIEAREKLKAEELTTEE